jgi:hypothetical protein
MLDGLRAHPDTRQLPDQEITIADFGASYER